MRLTVIFDDDIFQELRRRAKKEEKSFERVLNESLRIVLNLYQSSLRKIVPFQVKPHSSAFRQKIDINKLNQLADQLAEKEKS